MSGTIALFGATGASGSQVLPAALEAGYNVRIMVRTPLKVTVKHPNLTIIEGDVANNKAIQETIDGADYVISTVGGPLGKPETYPTNMVLNFVKELVPLMNESPSVKVFLHQSGAFVAHPDGTHPVSMKIMNKVVGQWLAGIGPNLQENDNVQKYVYGIQDEIKFKTICTRPGRLVDGPEGTKLAATEGAPMGSTTYRDLGKFTVEAITTEGLYGTYPFVGNAPKEGDGCCLM